ncbi:MAG TPA: DMT family transporter [Alphaproteobacteria bacterium]|nr:DMT family transporter [Alphaproteobacteria bacterium]
MKLTSTAQGLLCSALAFGFFTLVDTISKVLLERYSPFETMGVTLFISSAVVFLFALATKGRDFKKEIRPHNKALHLWRGITQFLSSGLFCFALIHMPLAEFYVIVFLAPIFVALLSAAFLKEKLTPALVISTLVSFAGAVIALRPAQGFDIWALVAVAGSIMNAVVSLVLRKQAPGETALSPAMTVGAIVGVLSLVPAAFSFTMPDAKDAGLLLLAGILYACGQITVVRAFRLAPASLAVAPQFLQLVYGAITGFLVFGHVPSIWIYVGGAIVVGANLYLLYTQNKKAKRLS